MPTRPVQTTCPNCGRYGWHDRTISKLSAAPVYKCHGCKQEHQK